MSLRDARFTDHALRAMARRGIALPDVRSVLGSPQAVATGNRPGRQVVQAPAEIGEPPVTLLLRVVLDVTETPAAVITVYATRQFARYGAKP